MWKWLFLIDTVENAGRRKERSTWQGARNLVVAVLVGFLVLLLLGLIAEI